MSCIVDFSGVWKNTRKGGIVTFQTTHSCYWMEGPLSCLEYYSSCSSCPTSTQVKILPVAFVSTLVWSVYFYCDLKILNIISLVLLFQLLNVQKVRSKIQDQNMILH